MPRKYAAGTRRRINVFSPRILKLLAFLPRRQAWLSPPEIASSFRLNGRPVSAMTLYRWFAFLEQRIGLAYFPHPRMNLLGLADMYVRVQGPRSPAVLATVPFGHSFFAELGLDGRPFLSQSYWIPGPGLRAFEEYWRAAKDLALVQEVEVMRVRNTHFIFSPFDEVLRWDGWGEVRGEVDNAYFEPLIRRHLDEPFDVRVGERIAASPLVIPVLLEHLWRHCSSRQVWQAIRAKGEGPVRRYAMGRFGKAFKKPGAALRLLYKEWEDLLDHFDEVFLQPIVFWPPGLIRNCPLLTFTVEAGSPEKALQAAMLASRKSVVTALLPEVGTQGRCRIWCNPPSEEFSEVLRLMGEVHRGSSPPAFGVVDLKATRRLAQPAFAGFDWRHFDPETLSWTFDGEAYVEALKAL